MSFYSNIINWMRGANNSYPTKQYSYGTIQSGNYSNWHKDAHPTILCLGTYLGANGKYYTHGIQLHEIDSFSLQWLIEFIINDKRTNSLLNPRMLYTFFKTNNYNLVRTGYRIYHTELCNFNMISPGLSNMDVKLSSQINDYRDTIIKNLNNYLLNPDKQNVQSNINEEELKNQINNAINTKKIW